METSSGKDTDKNESKEQSQKEERVSPRITLVKHPSETRPTIMSPEERDRLRQLSQLSLWLDGYDDLFSDFDPRNYSQRALSDDFLSEAKKMVREKRSGKIELNLIVPLDKRSLHNEGIIKKRLREHFKKQYEDLRKQKFKTLKEASIFIAVGIIVMITATLLFLQEEATRGFSISFLIILLEPAGWFLFWEGLNLMIFDAKRNNQSIEFNKKLASCEISFSSY